MGTVSKGSLPRAPDAVEHRKEIASSDAADYSGITKADGLVGNHFRFAMLKVNIESTTLPNVTITTLIWDDDYGWLEHVEGQWTGANGGFAAPVEILGQRFFIHVKIVAGTGVKVSVKCSGLVNRLEAA